MADEYMVSEADTGTMVHAKIVSDTAKGLASGAMDYISKYNPAGYGTKMVSDISKTNDGRWVVSMVRYSSCD